MTQGRLRSGPPFGVPGAARTETVQRLAGEAAPVARRGAAPPPLGDTPRRTPAQVATGRPGPKRRQRLTGGAPVGRRPPLADAARRRRRAARYDPGPYVVAWSPLFLTRPQAPRAAPGRSRTPS
ncbi:hypothetical protein GCM10010277_40270 [Streptomyces longisporoflavus]|nr:hypothetical protein GCM10010277_40270 [Streptomyces longisporoflavus]